MANLVRLSYLLEFHGLQIGNVYQQLRLGSEFRAAIGAEKIQGVWFVDADLVPSFDPAHWNMYGERREVVDASRYTRVSSMDVSDERTKRVCDLISKSQAVKSALGATTFNRSRALYVKSELLSAFNPDEWLYCHERKDWAKESDLHMVPLVRAVFNLSNKAEILRKFRLNPLVREALGAKRYNGDRKWWIDRNLLAEFDARYWPVYGEKRERIFGEEPTGPTPRTFDQRVVNEKQPGMLTMREAAWIAGLDKNKLRKRLSDSELAEKVGAIKSESGFWFFDEVKLRTHFALDELANR